MQGVEPQELSGPLVDDLLHPPQYSGLPSAVPQHLRVERQPAVAVDHVERPDDLFLALDPHEFPGLQVEHVVGVFQFPVDEGELLPPLICSGFGTSLRLRSWYSLNTPMATARIVASKLALPDRTSSTYCLMSHDGTCVGAARSSSVAWHENLSSSGEAPAPCFRVAAVSIISVRCDGGSGAGPAGSRPSAGTRLSHASFQ